MALRREVEADENEFFDESATGSSSSGSGSGSGSGAPGETDAKVCIQFCCELIDFVVTLKMHAHNLHIQQQPISTKAVENSSGIMFPFERRLTAVQRFCLRLMEGEVDGECSSYIVFLTALVCL